jgi:PhnB protein
MAKKARKSRKTASKASGRAKVAPRRVKAQPASFHTITPQLTVRDAARAIDFYKRALGAREVARMASPDGKIMHAELRIGDSVFFLGDEFPEGGCRSPESLGGTSGALHVYVPNVDAAFKRAVDAGAQSRMPVADMFWGDRYGKIADPFGHEWGLATHKEDLTSAQQKKRAEEFFKQAGGQHG